MPSRSTASSARSNQVPPATSVPPNNPQVPQVPQNNPQVHPGVPNSTQVPPGVPNNTQVPPGVPSTYPFPPNIAPPSSQPRPPTVPVSSSESTESGDESQPILDENERVELRRMITGRQFLLTESSNFNLWHTNLLRVLTHYKLEQHIIQRIVPTSGDEDSVALCQLATDIVRSYISTPLLETMQTRYNTDPTGNAYTMVTDAKRAVTQVDIYTGPELYYTMVTSERQSFADTGSYVTQMMSIREKLANTADDFKVTDRLFAWLLIRGYKGTDYHVANDMENDLMRGAKTSQEVIRQLQHIGEREKVLMSTAAVRTNNSNKRKNDSKPEAKYAPWPSCAPCGGRKHPPRAHHCKSCNCFHSKSNSCAPKCGKKCGSEFHYLSCKTKSRFVCPADRIEFQKQHTTNTTTMTNPPSASNSIFKPSGQIETYGYGPGKATEHSLMSIDLSQALIQIPHDLAASAIFNDLKEQWLMDSGSARTICNDIRLYGDDFRPIEGGVKLATTAGVAPVGEGIGTISVLAEKPDGSPCRIILKEAIYDPKAMVNIFSVGAVREWGLEFDGRSKQLVNEAGEGVAMFEWYRNVPFLKLHNKHHDISARAIDFWTLHARLGHANLDATIEAGKQADYRVLNKPKDLSGCSTCHAGKDHQQKKGFERPKISNALEVLDVDIIHHAPLGFGGMNVFIHIRCRGSGFSWGKACKSTTDAAIWLANHLLFLRRQMGDRFLTHTIVVDCDSHILSRITEICKNEGIAIEVSPPYAHEANGGAEGSGKTIMTRERCMIIDAGLPEYFWPFALDYSLTVLNLTPQIHRVDRKSPFTLLAEAMGRGRSECKSYIYHLRRWACICWIHIHPLDQRNYNKGRKAKERAEPGRFLGFEDIHGRVVIVFHCRRNKVIRARDITFMEDEFDLPFVEFDDIWPTEEPEETLELRREDNRQISDQNQFDDVLETRQRKSVRTSDSGPSGGGNQNERQTQDQITQQKHVRFIEEPLTPISLSPEPTPDVTSKRHQPGPIRQSKRVRTESTRNQFDIDFGKLAIDLSDDTENRNLDLSMSAFWLDPKLSFREHFNIRYQKAEKVLQALSALSRRNGLPMDLLHKIQVAAVHSVALYGSEIWWEGQKDKLDKIQKLLNKQARAITGMFKTTPIPLLQREANLPDAPGLLDAKRLGFTLRCLEQTEGHPSRSILPPSLRFGEMGELGELFSETNLEWATKTKGGNIGKRLARHLNKTVPITLENGIDYYCEWVKPGEFPGTIKIFEKEQAIQVAKFADNTAVFTDGSRTGKQGSEKTGAATAQKNEGVWKVKGWHLGYGKTALDAELFALSQALKTALKQTQPTLVFTDSQSGLELIKQGQNLPSIIKEIWKDAEKLKLRGTPTTLLWVPGHEGVKGNEEADKAAKKATKGGKNADPTVSILYLREQATKRKAKQKNPFYPALRMMKKALTSRFLQLKSGHAKTGSYMKKFKLSDSAKCKWCGNENENTTHAILHCKKWTKQRKLLMKNLRIKGIFLSPRLNEKDTQKLFQKETAEAMLSYLSETQIGASLKEDNEDWLDQWDLQQLDPREEEDEQPCSSPPPTQEPHASPPPSLQSLLSYLTISH